MTGRVLKPRGKLIKVLLDLRFGFRTFIMKMKKDEYLRFDGSDANDFS